MSKILLNQCDIEENSKKKAFDVDKVLNQKEFKAHIEKLKDTSKDPANNEYMCDCASNVINFDKVMTKYCNQFKKDTLKSVDSIFSISSKEKTDKSLKMLIFLEFKNGRIVKNNLTEAKSKELYEIRQKISESLLVFSDIVDCKLSDLRQNAGFILVYDSNKNVWNEETKNKENKKTGLEKIHDRLCERADTKMIKFGFHNLKGVYFKEVHTFSKEEFQIFLAENQIGHISFKEA